MSAAVLLVCGSTRAKSLNRQLLATLATKLSPRITSAFLELSHDVLPMYSRDLEADGRCLAVAARLHSSIVAARGLIVASPEHNGLISAFLENVVDWISILPRIDRGYVNAFQGKPLLLCSASTGSTGGAQGLNSARTLFSHLGARVMSGTICLPHADTKLREGRFFLCNGHLPQAEFQLSWFERQLELRPDRAF